MSTNLVSKQIYKASIPVKGIYAGVDIAADRLSDVGRYSPVRLRYYTLVDVTMLNLNGVKVCHFIQGMDHQAPVILMASYSDEDLIELANVEGAKCIMHKPLHIDKMIEIIQHALPSSEKEPVPVTGNH